MPESTQHYFDLSLTEQAELLHGLAPVLGRRAEMLEKDIWLCQTGGLRLIPDAALLNALQQDYQAMLNARMFYGETPVFDRIVERLTTLEREINRQG